MERPLSIAQVNGFAFGGGAETVARQLHEGFLARGHTASVLVGRGGTPGVGLLPFPNDLGIRVAHVVAGPMRLVDRHRGLESYRYPRTRRMMDALPVPPDIVHLHNLHGGYFDLRVLPELSGRVPVVLTLHDAWLLSGHCAHSLGCERWRIGCGACPDLTIYPEVRRDATARNWERKRDIFRRSRLFVATPSLWLADMVRESILAPALEDLTVIPNGVDLRIYRPGDREAARTALELPIDGFSLLFVGTDARRNPFKDLETAERAVARAADLLGQDLTMIVLGGEGPELRRERAQVRFVPFQSGSAHIAAYYQASDLYMHAARADTHPLAVLEALACGIPVVATAVGGIPEQVRVAPLPDWRDRRETDECGDATGVLVAPGDPESMGSAIATLLDRRPLREEMGENAARDAELRFDGEQQCDTYLEWFRSILHGPS